MNQGWECPRCTAINSPLLTQCNCYLNNTSPDDFSVQIKAKNIIAFLTIILADLSDEAFAVIINISPSYLIEKFERYVVSYKAEYGTGMHPTARQEFFDMYCKKWQSELNNK